MKVEEVAIAKGMLLRGRDRQHDIAAFLGVNPGRIAEIKAERRYAHVKAAPFNELPEAKFEHRLRAIKPRGASRADGLHDITRAACSAGQNIQQLFSQRCRKYKPLSKDEADHLFSVLQELGTFYLKLSQDVSNYQQGESNGADNKMV